MSSRALLNLKYKKKILLLKTSLIFLTARIDHKEMVLHNEINGLIGK
jgi:hypothetical protein